MFKGLLGFLKIWKSVKIWQNYGHDIAVSNFWPTMYNCFLYSALQTDGDATERNVWSLRQHWGRTRSAISSALNIGAYLLLSHVLLVSCITCALGVLLYFSQCTKSAQDKRLRVLLRSISTTYHLIFTPSPFSGAGYCLKNFTEASPN